MDIATATTTATIKTPDAETEAPARIQPNKPTSFTNGLLKRHQPLNHHHHGPPVVIIYKECLKNHAASLGGHAVDGCGEFMPSPTSTPADPTSLKCAACGCHRNFHRREPEEPLPPIVTNNAPSQHVIEYQPHHRHHPPPPPLSRHGGGGANSSSPNSPSPPPISSSYYPSAPHMLLALSAGLSAAPPESNPSIPTTPGTSRAAATVSNPNGRKRFRTKFTHDQKQRMQEFAERVGWKMQKREEELIAGFCSEIGVEKGVFKVWMHNNKSTFGKREISNNLDSNHYNHHDDHNDTTGNNRLHNLDNNDSVSPPGHAITTNGSSSSS